MNVQEEAAEQKLGLRFKAVNVWASLLVIGAPFFLYWFSFVQSSVPMWIYGDVPWDLVAGQRLVQGEVMYRDFFAFLMPGTAIVDALLIKLFGPQPWIPSLLTLLLGLGLVWLGVIISRKLMRPGVALLVPAFYLVYVHHLIYSPTHHWFSLVSALAAIAVLVEHRTTARIVAAGALCGVDACFTQSTGLTAVAGFAVFLWLESRRRNEGSRAFLRNAGCLAAGFAATLLLVNGYFLLKAGPANYFWCTVVFVLKYYSKASSLNTPASVLYFFPEQPSFPNRLQFYVFTAKFLFDLVFAPVMFLFIFVRYWRVKSIQPWDEWARPMLVGIVGFFLFLSTANSPINSQMVCAVPAFILLGWTLDSSGKLPRLAVVICFIGVLLVALHSMVRSRPAIAGIISTPRGNVAISIFEKRFAEYNWIQQNTQAAEYFYVPTNLSVNYYLYLRNPTPMPYVLNNGYTTTGQVAGVIQGLESHPTRYILLNWDDLTEFNKGENPSEAHLGPLREYIHNHYHAFKLFPASHDEIWERTEPGATNSPKVTIP